MFYWLHSILLLLISATFLQAKPNVLILLTDDQGWGDLNIHGNQDLSTPHLDSLAKRGAQAKWFFVQPVCSPSRSEFLTGKYHPRLGVRDVSRGGERLDLQHQTIANFFQAEGYRTGLFGKWHNGSQYPYHPLGRGFQEYFGFTSGHWGDYYNAPLDKNGLPVRGQGYMPDDLTNQAMQFMAKSEVPFFCVVTYNTPHSPMQVPDEYWNRFKDKKLQFLPDGKAKENLLHTKAALAMVENIDWNVGRLLQFLQTKKLEENTIVVYFSDNGPNGNRWNGGMKGRKGSTDDGGVRSPLFIRWMNHIPAGTIVEPIMGAIDLFPTLHDLTQLKTPLPNDLDGLSFAKYFLGTATDFHDRALFQTWNNQVSIRTQQYRYDPSGKLFDMQMDPRQQKDIAAQHPLAILQFRKQLEEWKTYVRFDKKSDDRPFPVGYSQMPRTELPARDGQFSGAIQRSANAPNCSYFTNWSKPTDTIYWDIDVHTTGSYQLEVLYTCKDKDKGVTLRAESGKSILEVVVADAHDPPARGAENDRAKRVGESLVKDFRPLRFGIMQLQAGKQRLQFNAPVIPGSQAIELRSAVLTLQSN